LSKSAAGGDRNFDYLVSDADVIGFNMNRALETLSDSDFDRG
jgi:hypothetical protein